MNIIQHPSPNHNARRHPLDMLVLHYTGMEDGPSAIERLCDPAFEVSAHYVVEEDGRVFQLVPEAERAWHAGQGSWQGDEDLNSRSIGIEIVNGGHNFPLPDGSLPPFPDVQIEAVIELCKGILNRHSIPQSRVIGHSDLAPDRKEDPGEHFPWSRLAENGIGLWPERPDLSVLRGRGLGNGDRGASVTRMKEDLVTIGYASDTSELYDAACECVVRAFQRRWVQDRVTGQADLTTLTLIDRVAALVNA